MIYDGEKGDIINQYVTFTKIYNDQIKLHGRTRKAVWETIHICRNQDVLKEYLEQREKEVVDIMMTLFDDEQILEAYVKDIDDNATHREAKETAERMIKDGELSLEKIARYVPALSMEELKELEAEIMQLA